MEIEWAIESYVLNVSWDREGGTRDDVTIGFQEARSQICANIHNIITVSRVSVFASSEYTIFLQGGTFQLECRQGSSRITWAF